MNGPLSVLSDCAVREKGIPLFVTSKGDLTTKVLKKIKDVNPAEWDAVFPDVVEGYSFFKTLDQSGFEQFSFYYVLVYERETLVGAATCFLMSYPLDTTVQGVFKAFSNGLKKFFPNALSLKAVICGLPMEQGQIGILRRTPEVLKAISGAIEKIAEKEKAAIIAFKDFGCEYESLLAPLEQEGFYKFESLPNTDMEIRFDSFEGYLKTLSKASREGLKRKFKKTDGQIAIDLEITNELNGELDEVYGLYRQTVESHEEMSFEQAPKEFFKNISRNMPGETKYFLWRVGKKLVAFALCLVKGDLFVDYYLGFDYSVAFQYHLYFIRFRDLMKWCIQNGIRRYEMGATNYEPKRRLGFDFVPVYGYAKLRNRWLNPFFKGLCAFLKPSNFDPVFKQMKKKQP